MEKLVRLLENSGVGFITGHYRSARSARSLAEGKKKLEHDQKMFVNLSVNGVFLGEYLLGIINIDKEEKCISCSLYENGEYFSSNKLGSITFILTHFGSYNDDIGEFVAKGDHLCIPKEYKG